MDATVITQATGLRIWPTHSIVAYLVRGSKVHVAFDRPPFAPSFTPASLTVSDDYDNGRYRKTAVFSVPETSEAVSNRFLTLLKTYIMIVYTDGRGVDRVMGGPQWPASLSFERSGGSLKVTVEAWGDAPNHEYVGPGS